MIKKNIFLLAFILNINSSIFSSKIYVNSIPKSGTNLLFKCITLMTGNKPKVFKTEDILKNGLPQLNKKEFLVCHMPYLKEWKEKFINLNYSVFFIFRDPRDQIVSHANWIMEQPTLFDYYKNIVNPMNTKNLIDVLIKDVVNFYKYYLPWQDFKFVCPIKFENLVGRQGGGRFHLQYREIKKIASHIGLPLNHKKIINCIGKLFGGTGTFRKGQIGSWKKEFTAQQKEDFKKYAGQLLIDLGYEKNLNW